MTVFVEASVLDDVHLKNNPLFEPLRFKVKTFRDGKDDLTDKVDFIICLGGDGTLLYASSLFQVRGGCGKGGAIRERTLTFASDPF